MLSSAWASLCVLKEMATKGRLVLRSVFTGLRAHAVWYQSSASTPSQGRLLWRPQLRHLSCSYGLCGAAPPSTGTHQLAVLQPLHWRDVRTPNATTSSTGLRLSTFVVIGQDSQLTPACPHHSCFIRILLNLPRCRRRVCLYYLRLLDTFIIL